MKKKQYSMKMSDYFQLNRPDYVYLKLIPSTSVKNNKACDIAGIINGTYVDVVKRFKKQNKGFSYTLPHKVSFVVDINKDNASFYMIVPRLHVKEFTQKLTEAFGKITIDEVDGITGIRKDCTKYSLEYARDDSLSIAIDRRDNDLLSANLSVMDILQDGDRVTILYNFLPTRKMELASWRNYHNEMMRKYKNGKSLDKTFTAERAVFTALNVLYSTIEVIESSMQWFATGKENNNNSRKRIIPMNDLTKASLKKEDAEILKTQIFVMSQSVDKDRESENAKALVNTFSVVGDKQDNRFIAKKIDDKKTKNIGIKKKKKSNSIGIVKRHKLNKIDDKVVIEEVEEIPQEDCIDFGSYNFDCEDSINKMSCEEVGGNLIALAGKTLIEEYGLDAIQHNETKIPEELQCGNAVYGTNTFRGKDTVVTTSIDEDANCMPVVVMAKMGGGKTSFFENQGVNVVGNGEGLISIDFIKNCEMSDNIIRNIDKDKVIEINFADYMCQEGFGFNEFSMIRKNDNPMSIYECAVLQNAQITQFIDSLGDEEFSASMGRYLDAACTAVLIHEHKSIRDIVRCLEDWKVREKYMKHLSEFKNLMPEEYRELIDEDLTALEELNEYKKVKNGSEDSVKLAGTNTSKIAGIISRIAMLKKNPALKFMYVRGTKNNINLTELMQQGKAIFFKMPQSRFSSTVSKNVIVSYLFSKIEIAGLIRAEVYGEENLRTVNVICDEVQQARDSFNNIGSICNQLRKFRTKLILSAHGWKNIAPIRDDLINAGATIMMLKGSSVKDFEVMRGEFEKFGFTQDDLISLSHTPKYKALCLIATKQGRYGCIVELPKPVKNKIELKNVVGVDFENKQKVS